MSEQNETIDQTNFEDNLLKYGEPFPFEGQTSSGENLEQPKQIAQLPQLDQKPTIEEILNAMFPPRYFEQQGQRFQQNVSIEEASRQDLQELEIELQERLKQRQSRASGICPVREDLHNQLLDEIIRQCTINCPERGILLLKVRDQIRLSLAAYQTLYQGSVIFGIRKQLQAEQGRPEMEQKIQEFEKKKIMLENKKIQLENQLQSTQQYFKEVREIEDSRKQNEIKFLKYQQKHLDSFLKTVKSQQ